MSSRNCAPLIDPNSLVQSIISKMMYTCSILITNSANPYCKHRVNRSPCTSTLSHCRHYNCAGFPRLDGAVYRNQASESRSRSPCGCYGEDNPEESLKLDKSRLSPSRHSGMCLSSMPAAGDYERE